jgi:translation initiation factor IF-3
MDNVNDGITVPNVRAVFPDGSIEFMPTAIAVRKAQAMGLDLILIAPTAMPPVAKAMNYEQWLRENKRKQRDD